MWITLGWVLVFALPGAVLIAVVCWPERLPKDRTVEAIRQHIEDEDG